MHDFNKEHFACANSMSRSRACQGGEELELYGVLTTYGELGMTFCDVTRTCSNNA